MMSIDLELPEIRAWARAELAGYTDSEVARVIHEWSSAESTRFELHSARRANRTMATRNGLFRIRSAGERVMDRRAGVVSMR
jgi:hypothetical protein